MKLIQKSLLFASLLAVGTGITSIPAITSGNGSVQAASTTTTIPNMKANGFYYRVSKNKLIKASDVKIIFDGNETTSGSVDVAMPNNFRLKVTTSKAQLYDLQGKKISEKLSEGNICTIGSQYAFNNSTYYQESKNKMIQVTDSSWI